MGERKTCPINNKLKDFHSSNMHRWQRNPRMVVTVALTLLPQPLQWSILNLWGYKSYTYDVCHVGFGVMLEEIENVKKVVGTLFLCSHRLCLLQRQRTVSKALLLLLLLVVVLLVQVVVVFNTPQSRRRKILTLLNHPQTTAVVVVIEAEADVDMMKKIVVTKITITAGLRVKI